MAGMAERDRRTDDRAGSGLLDEWGLAGDDRRRVVCVSGGNEGLGGGAAFGLEGSCSTYILSSSSLVSGTIAPWLMRASMYCEARYAINMFNFWR